MDGIVSPQTDSLLQPYLLASDEFEADRLLADLLVNHAAPRIARIVKSCIGLPDAWGTRNGSGEWQDVEDVVSEAIVNVLDRLRRLKDPLDRESISDFMGYVAVVTRHTCDNYLRLRYPNRTRLRSRLRYVLTYSSEFAIWKQPDENLVCGFSNWRDRRSAVPAGWTNQALMDVARFIKCERTDDLKKLLCATFTGAQAPIDLNDVVTLAAEILGVSDEPVSIADYMDSADVGLADDFNDPLDVIAQRLLLRRIWKEIVQLPLKQRVSLLLAVKDEDRTSIAVLLTEIRIASVSEIGAAVGMTVNEFARLLPELPLSDMAISKRLGVSRQQILNGRYMGRLQLRAKVNSGHTERTREKPSYKQRNKSLSHKNGQPGAVRRHQRSHFQM